MNKRILCIASGIENASFRFRIQQYIPDMRRLGIEVDIADVACDATSRRKIIDSVGDYDSVIIHRSFLKVGEFGRFVRRARRYVYDFDDAIMFRDSGARKFNSWQRQLRFKRMIGGATAIIAGNSYLGEKAARFNQATTVIPTTVELRSFNTIEPVEVANHQPIIGWIGTRVNLMYLEPLKSALARITREHEGVGLKIVCDAFPELPGVNLIKKVWTLQDEITDVQSFQIGIMPLPDDPWTRGKCALKLLQYMAAAIPVVCSPVGTNVQVVQEGQNGYFAKTEDEWVARVSELLADADKQRAFGAAGRALIVDKYSVEANLHQFVTVLLGKSAQAET